MARSVSLSDASNTVSAQVAQLRIFLCVGGHGRCGLQQHVLSHSLLGTSSGAAEVAVHFQTDCPRPPQSFHGDVLPAQRHMHSWHADIGLRILLV